ncbi:hypothetical protein [Bradyrhizobium sp.]|uniref:hypothetical protein n=1 Tax=Bradyrhizobium sp. TaxID=376 RepID=UPI00273678B0|nr:hypothetical protein [Bradyrhizobium sp.]MDP3075722.1 hypothetical protein [Bradyrhizobium sp.]
MMPLRLCRKARALEKVENLYCTATAQKSCQHALTIEANPSANLPALAFPLPDMSHFAAKFCEYCAPRTGLSFPKVGPQPGKLLAMQRAAL